ncbi:MAG: DUF4352 domain-containing protein [Oscillospiraceae bacterium]|nr:DUF4352 domain-containing protein [Oscillospiraceae bacterium]
MTGVFLMMAAGSGSDDNSTAQKVGEVEQTVSSADEEKEKTPQPDGDEAPEDSVTQEEADAPQEAYHVGDILKTDALEIVYKASGYYVSDNEFIQPKEGNQYIFIELYCTNIGDSDQSIDSYSFTCYADGYSCESTYFSDNDLSASLSPGRSASGIVAFEVPQDASDIQIEYELDLWSEEKAVFVFEGDKDSGFEPEADAAASESAFHAGDIVETDALRIAYLSCGEYTGYNEFDPPKDGYHYVYCELEFENISDNDQYVSYTEFDCFADSSSCEAYYGTDDLLDATISPGRKAKGTVAYEVPLDAQTVEFEFLTNLWTSDRIVFACQP